MKTYRDWQKRFIFDEAVYFVTFYTTNRYPFFKEAIFCDLFVEQLRLSKKIKGFNIFGWVIAYDHIHLLIKPNNKWNISKVIFTIKKQSSHNINRIIGLHHLSTSPESEQAFAHFQGNMTSCDTAHFQKALRIFRISFMLKYNKDYILPKFQWHKSFHDHYIRNNSDFNNHMEYIIRNPQKHNLPDDWTYIFTHQKYKDFIDYPY